MKQADIVFPFATGAYLLVAFALALGLYKRSGFKPTLIFAFGALAVAIESFLDGYEAYVLTAYNGSWDVFAQSVSPSKLNYLLAIDAIRGLSILVWAAIEVIFTAALAGTTRKLYTTYIPAAIIVLGGIATFAANFSGIEPLHKRILISSVIRVGIILVPVSIAAGVYILAKLWRPTRARSLALIGAGFILHGVTLPFYTPAKSAGAFALGLWYAIGGIIPVTAFVVGLYLAIKEAEAAARGA